jgi:FLVCR family feline leukemia virus subgroup C receptor-related protein
MFGIYSSFGAILSNLYSPFGYSGSDISLIGVVFVVSGLIGAPIYGYILDKTQKYLLALRVICVGTLVCGLMLFITIPAGNIYLLLANCSALGFFLLPIIPVGYSFASEITFPISEAMSNGLMIMSSQLCAIILTPLVTWIIKKDPISCLYYYMGLTVFAIVLSIFVKENLKRLA